MKDASQALLSLSLNIINTDTDNKKPTPTQAQTIPNGSSSISVSILNLIKLLMGSGMLVMPWGFAHVGILPSIFALIVCAFLDAAGAMLLVISSQVSQQFEYSSLLRFVGRKWELLGAVCILYGVSLTLIGYVILFGDFLFDIFKQIGVQNFTFEREIYIITFCALILTPLIMLKDLSSLKYSSFFGIAAIFYVLILVVYLTISSVTDPQFVFGTANNNNSNIGQRINAKHTDNSDEWSLSESVQLSNMNIGWFIISNIATQAYVSHYTIQQLYLDLEQRSVKRMSFVCVVAYSIAGLIYIIFGTCGYLLYGNNVPSDIMDAFGNTGASVIIARLAMIISLTGTFPLGFVACQATLEDKFFRGSENPTLKNVVKLITMLFYICLGTLLPTIGPVVSINGAISCIGLIFGFPVLISWYIGFEAVSDAMITQYGSIQQYLFNKSKSKITEKENTVSVDKQQQQQKQLTLTAKIGLTLLLAIGLVLGLLGLIVEFLEINTNLG